MKKHLIQTVLLTTLLIITLLVSGCGTILVTKNGEGATGEVETRQYNFSDFTRVDIGSAFRYEINRSDSYGISITANDNLFNNIEVTQDGQTLIISREFPEAPWAIQINTQSAPKVIITMPQIDALNGSGATHGTVKGFSLSGELDVTASGASTVELADITASNGIFNVSGSSQITGDFESEKIDLTVSGASRVRLTGSAVAVTAGISGASRLELAGLTAIDADINLSGASSGKVNLNGTLDAKISGSSTLEYTGEPSLGAIDITGTSKLREK